MLLASPLRHERAAIRVVEAAQEDFAILYIDSKGWLLLRRACAKASLDFWSTASNKLRKKSRTKLLLEDIVSAGRCATLIA